MEKSSVLLKEYEFIALVDLKSRRKRKERGYGEGADWKI